MSESLLPVEETAEIRQGDIVKAALSGTNGRHTYGVIVTADCDIAQRKHGNKYTWLDILPLEDYLEDEWAPDQLTKIVKKQAKSAAEAVNGLIKKSGHDLGPITADSLCIWLSDKSVEEIFDKINKTGQNIDKKLTSVMNAIREAVNLKNDIKNLDRLMRTWSALGRDEKWQQSAIKEAMNGENGFPDYVLVPELPEVNGLGFVVLLRSINSIEPKNVFQTELDARINGVSNTFYRIGRFSDRIRFSIAQKMAFLFSRIGMTKNFENECGGVTDLAIEALYSSAQAKAPQ